MKKRPDWATGREWAGWVWVDYFERFEEAAEGECEPDEGFLERHMKRGVFAGLNSVADREVNIIRNKDGRFVIAMALDDFPVHFEDPNTARKIVDLIVSDSSIGGWE